MSESSDEEMEEIINDKEYREFVEKFGHVDFFYLNYLPKIKTKQQLIESRKKMQEDSRHHGHNYIVTKTCERMARF